MHYVLKRLLELPLVVFSVILVNFIIIHSAPGDPAVFLAGFDAPPGYIQNLRLLMGLDKPLYAQFFTYISNFLSGNLGPSYTYHGAVLNIIADHIPATVLLVGTSILFSSIIGILLAIFVSSRAESKIDTGITSTAVTLSSVPDWWMGLLLILAFGVYIRLFPTNGMNSIIPTQGLSYVTDLLRHLALPALTLSISRLSTIYRLTRGSMVEALRSDYVVTARAKGASRIQVLFRHAFRNALFPIVTSIGLDLRNLVVGSVFVEVVFAWPGVGWLMYNAVTARDYNLALGVFGIVAIATITANLLTDIVYAQIDPRIRYQ